MRKLLLVCALWMMAIAFSAAAQEVPYRILKTIRPGGTGSFDYVFADESGRNLYIPRLGDSGRITVFSLDTLEHVGDIPDANAHGVAVSRESMHGFATSKPVVMWDARTFAPIKTIDVDGAPDGILYDSFNDRIYVFSHKVPNATVISASDGSILGVIDLGGAPEQAVTDDQGRIYVDIEDKDSIAVIDAVTMEVRNHYSLVGMGGTCAGLAMDVKNQILFASCRNPHTMVILSARDGKILHGTSHWSRNGRSRIRSDYYGSFQFGKRWHADGDQGEQPDKFCCRTDSPDNAEREDLGARCSNEPRLPDCC